MRATVRRTGKKVEVSPFPKLVNNVAYYVTDDQRVFTEYELYNVR